MTAAARAAGGSAAPQAPIPDCGIEQACHSEDTTDDGAQGREEAAERHTVLGVHSTQRRDLVVLSSSRERGEVEVVMGDMLLYGVISLGVEKAILPSHAWPQLTKKTPGIPANPCCT